MQKASRKIPQTDICGVILVIDRKFPFGYN